MKLNTKILRFLELSNKFSKSEKELFPSPKSSDSPTFNIVDGNNIIYINSCQKVEQHRTEKIKAQNKAI